MDVLLRVRADAAGLATWLDVLQRALPHVVWHATEAIDPTVRARIEVAVVANPPPGSLQGFPRLRLIQSLWAGVDRLLDDPTLPANCVLARMVDPQLATAMAESVQWAVLSLHRHFFRYADQQTAGLWRPLPQRGAHQFKVAVLGMGEMARPAILRLLAMGYPVKAWSQSGIWPGSVPYGLTIFGGTRGLNATVSGAEVVINLLPLTPATRNFLNRRFFSQMALGASLVNFARGAHLVADDLLQALQSGRLSHAVLDVFDAEPLPAGHPFWSQPQITVLPHVSALTDPDSAAMVVAQQLRCWQDGLAVAHVVDRTKGY